MKCILEYGGALSFFGPKRKEFPSEGAAKKFLTEEMLADRATCGRIFDMSGKMVCGPYYRSELLGR